MTLIETLKVISVADWVGKIEILCSTKFSFVDITILSVLYPGLRHPCNNILSDEPQWWTMALQYIPCNICIYNNTHQTLQWRHNERDGVSNHQPHDCLLTRSFRCRSKETSKLLVTDLCAGNSPVTGDFPSQRPVTWKMFPFDDIIMKKTRCV